MKVSKATGSDSKTTSEIDLSEYEIPKSLLGEVKREVGDFLLEQILLSVGQAKRPVEGESWPSLSKDYKEKKVSENLPGKANLEASGSLLDALTYRQTKDGLEIGFFGDQAAKADGHNKLSGRDNNTPQRRFLPDQGQSFKKSIESEVDKIIIDKLLEDAELTKKELKQVKSASDLVDMLKDKVGDFSKKELLDAVKRNEDLTDKLKNLDLMGLLGGKNKG